MIEYLLSILVLLLWYGAKGEQLDRRFLTRASAKITLNHRGCPSVFLIHIRGKIVSEAENMAKVESGRVISKVMQKTQQIIEEAEARANNALERQGEKMVHQLSQTGVRDTGRK